MDTLDYQQKCISVYYTVGTFMEQKIALQEYNAESFFKKKETTERVTSEVF